MTANTTSHKPRSRVQSESSATYVNEPALKGCRPNSVWRLRLIVSQLTKKFRIEVTFLTRDGKRGTLSIDNPDRSDFEKTRKALEAFNARLPEDKNQAIAFVKELTRKTPTRAVTACASPCFVNNATGFVMPHKRFGTARRRFVWDSEAAPAEVQAVRGTIGQYTHRVLEPAPESPYVSTAIMIALAAPLPDYVVAKGEARLVSESAIFHFAGESTSGKTTLGRIALSVSGSPEVEVDYEATDRGIAEHAYRRSNLTLVIDDTENAEGADDDLWKQIRRYAQRVPSGRSKIIAARSSKADLPNLKWSCNAISTGPETVAELTTRLRSPRRGDRVRILDIKLPAMDAGGIFGSKTTASGERAANSAQLVDGIETTIQQCHGVLFEAWVEFLLANDVSGRIVRLFDEFMESVAKGQNGLGPRLITNS